MAAAARCSPNRPGDRRAPQQCLRPQDGFGHVLTYAELDERIESIARSLRLRLPDQSREQSVVGVFQTPAVDWISFLDCHPPCRRNLPAPRSQGFDHTLKGYVKSARPAAILVDREMAGRPEEIVVEDATAIINVTDTPATVQGEERVATAARPDRPATSSSQRVNWRA